MSLLKLPRLNLLSYVNQLEFLFIMEKKDFIEFGKFMLLCGEMSVGLLKDREPSDERIFLYFCALSDLDIEQIKTNATLHFTQSDWFPGVASLRNPIPLKDRAVLDYDIVKKALDHAHTTDNSKFIARLKAALDRLNRPDLEPIAIHFADDFGKTPSGILRSQFTRYYQAFVKQQEIKKIEERTQQFLQFKPKVITEVT